VGARQPRAALVEVPPLAGLLAVEAFHGHEVQDRRVAPPAAEGGPNGLAPKLLPDL
jgi:hypothetical protein